MLIPISWLKRYVPVDLPAKELAHRLTMAGLEIDEVREVGADWGRDKVVVGHVMAVDRHPNADRLTMPTLDLGGGETATVVCGGPNLGGGTEDRLRPRRGDAVQHQVGEDATTEAIEDPRRRVGRHGLLGGRVGPRRGPRGHHGAPGGRARRNAARGLPRRCRSGRRRDPEPPRLSLDTGCGARGGRPYRRDGRRTRPDVPGVGRPHRAGRNGRDRRPRSLLTLRGQPDTGRHGRPVAGLAEGCSRLHGDAPDQQHSRRDELRHAGIRPAASRLRLRYDQETRRSS